MKHAAVSSVRKEQRQSCSPWFRFPKSFLVDGDEDVNISGYNVCVLFTDM